MVEGVRGGGSSPAGNHSETQDGKPILLSSPLVNAMLCQVKTSQCAHPYGDIERKNANMQVRAKSGGKICPKRWQILPPEPNRRRTTNDPDLFPQNLKTLTRGLRGAYARPA